MAFIVKQFNQETQTKGEWVEFGGAKFLIAYAQNPEFQKYHRNITKPFQRQIDKGTLGVEKETDLLCDSMAHAILLGWENVQFETDGVDTAYTKELAKMALILNPELREFVAGFAYDLDNFRNEAIEAQAKK